MEDSIQEECFLVISDCLDFHSLLMRYVTRNICEPIV